MNHHKQKGVRRGAGVGGAAGGAPGAAGEVQLRAALRSVTEDDPDQGGAAEVNSSQGMDDGCKSAKVLVGENIVPGGPQRVARAGGFGGRGGARARGVRGRGVAPRYRYNSHHNHHLFF